MTAVGIAMALVAALITLITSQPMPVALVVVGILFIAIGARQRREASPKR